MATEHDGVITARAGVRDAAAESVPLRWRQARRAISIVFFLNGLVLASWVPHIPAVKRGHAIGDGELGLILLSMAFGAVTALPLAGWLIDRFGSRKMTAGAATLFCLLLPLPVASPSVAVLCLALVLFGACNAMLDVSMNAQAAAIERAYGTTIMSSFHALFSAGGMLGAGLAGAAMSLGASDLQHVVVAAVASAGTVVAVRPWFADDAPRNAERGPVFARPRGALLRLGLLAFCGLLAEGAMGDWSAVYLRDTLMASPATASIGFAAFSLAMAAGRFGGDYSVRRLGAARMLRFSSALAAAGLAVALVFGCPVAGIVGCACVGLGIANIIPVLFSAAARSPGRDAGMALAAVATTGYCGFLAGPPLIGVAAELSSLPVALAIVSVACSCVALGAGTVRLAPARARETA